MEVGQMISNLISNIISIMQSFTFSISGYQVNLLEIFAFMLAFSIVIKMYNTLISHK